MEAHVERYSVDLRTVAKLQVGDCLGTKREFLTIEEPTVLRGAWRRYEGDDRERAIVAICRAVDALVVCTSLLAESRFLASDSFEIAGLPPVRLD